MPKVMFLATVFLRFVCLEREPFLLCDGSGKFLAPVYRGHTPQASPGRVRATRMEENKLTALLSKMGFPQILWAVADS